MRLYDGLLPCVVRDVVVVVVIVYFRKMSCDTSFGTTCCR
jgi:hypothetical protein